MILALAVGLLATRFHISSENGRQWLIDPEGKRFLSYGVCVVEPGTPFASYDPGNPSYAAWRYYASPQAWASDTVSRLQKWGFNTVGAWSDIDHLRQIPAKGMYFTPILHMGSGAGAPWRDMWDPTVVSTMDKIAHDVIVPLKGESRIIGYFSDNEQGWWEGGMFDWAWKGAGTRKHFVAVLRSRYASWEAMTRDFIPIQASNFSDLSRKGRLYLRPGGNGMRAVQAYMGVLAGRYYSLCRSIIKHYDPGGLYLGDRYISNFYPEVAKASAPYVDVCSTNLNADWNDGSFASFYLPTLEKATGKPIMITEYYMASAQNRSGNKNNSSGFPVAPTQKARAEGFYHETGFFFSHPYVVGAHWFQYYDEPKNGRGDGENYDMGLVDTDNRPYEELAAVSRAFAAGGFDRPEISSSVGPTFGGDGSNLELWHRSAETYVKPSLDCGRGDLYVADTRPRNEASGRAISAGKVLVAVYWDEDRFADAYYQGGKIPDVERARIEIKANGQSTTVVAGEGGPARIAGDGKILRSDAGVRNTVIVALPALAPGGPIEVRLATRGRAYTGSWIVPARR